MIIYKVTNKINQEIYIGATKRTLPIRKDQHIRLINKLPNRKFYKAITTFGLDNFKWEIIDDSAKDYNELKILERTYIYNLKPEYNSTKGGDGTSHTDETKKKISKSLKGRLVSEETRMLRSKLLKGKKRLDPPWNKGIPCSEETKKKISETKRKNKHLYSNKRIPCSEETKKKISESLKGKPLSDETKAKMSKTTKGRPSPLRGRRITQEHKDNISKSLKGVKKRRNK